MMNRLTVWGAIVAAAFCAGTTVAGGVDAFTIALEEQVSDGIPGPGAGNIEKSGAMDVYTIAIDAGTMIYVDEMGGGCAIAWDMRAPDDSEIFSDSGLCTNDPQIFELTQSGDYTITVFGENNATGTYSFTIWDVNPDDEFDISLKQVVSDGMPGIGAGNIEEPGARDVYTLAIDEAVTVFAQELSGGCGIAWNMFAPDETELFDDSGVCTNHPGIISLDQAGEYTIVVDGEHSVTGTYSFVIYILNEPDEFTIGLEEMVSDGIPGPGAGNIEEPGTTDVYTLTIDAPTTVYFDEQSGPCGIAWSALDPSDNEVFSDSGVCTADPQIFELTEVGDYTIIADGENAATGTYSFTVWEVNPTDVFSIGIDDLVSDGNPGPGAGNIEEPGTMDQYTFEGVAGDFVCFEELMGNCGIEWLCETPSGGIVFDDSGLCANDPGTFELPESGTYTITVDGAGSATGTYSFVINTSTFADLAPGNGDCRVNTVDLLSLLGEWGKCSEGDDCPADFNDDGVVDTLDLLTLLGAWTG